MKLVGIFIITVVLFTTTMSAQLSDFNLQVTKTDESCLGNGSLSFSVSNTTANAAVLYKVYLLPDTNVPIAILSENTLGSLSAGTYKVVALQSLGNLLKSKEQNVTIQNTIQPFSFSVTSLGQGCGGNGTIIVNTVSGVAASYEIISGPVTKPLQSTNTFENLPAGSYNVRAFNNCGVGKVKTFTLSVINSVLSISDSMYSDESVLCDSITVNNTITASQGTINYPLQVRHTLTPMTIGGDPIVINQTFATGSPESLEVSAVMPRLDEAYDYNITVTDNCNTVFERTGDVDPSIYLSLILGDVRCGEKYLVLNASKYTASYTVNFISAPEGFDPAAYNSETTFTESEVQYGNPNYPVPFGNYVVEITDACGRKATETILVELIIPSPNGVGLNNGCFSEFGRIRINVPMYKIVTATIIAAPDTYNQPLPHSVTGNINGNGYIVLNDLPLGVYTITFIDECGFVYTQDIEVPPFVEKDINRATLPACEAGHGTVFVRSGNGDLQSAAIIAAPAASGFVLPYDVTGIIDAQGDLYMAGLIEGTYTFRATDICGIVKEQTINVEGFRPSEDNFIFIPKCGGFSVKVTDTSNGIEASGYWLQKFNPATGKWMHPGTGSVYTEGEVPTNTTGIKLNNNSVRNNLNYSGKFRIIKKFEAFSHGNAEKTVCLSILGEFEYTENFAIDAAYSLACLGQPNDVILEVTGYPIAYKIVKKDNVPFVVNNGENNIFTNLEPAEYMFQIEDDCGNIITRRFNVQSLPSIADATNPGDMIVCAEAGTVHNYEFHLTDQNPGVLGPLHSAMYTITYHLTQEDADNGVNALPEYYTNVSNGQEIFVRLVHNEIALCHGTTSFKLFIGEYQEPVITTEGTICDDGQVMLFANGGYTNYLWSTGETTRSIMVSEPGIYTVIVEKAYGTKVCDGFAEMEIKASFTPTIKYVDTKDWTRDRNEITVYTKEAGDFEYSIDGINYQTENVFRGLETGIYNVYVKDAAGCGEDIKEIVLMHYPNFFTPNGDGVHDRWRIKYSTMEPNFKVTIFDRYGKMITSFGPNYEGWDGTLNGQQLPSTDYWFVVTREDGRELRGHFAMLR